MTARKQGGPLVSILIRCYHAERWVGEAIQSALDQTYCHAAVIVVDDGSTDGSLDAIKSFSGKIRWQAGRNCGADAARDRVPEVRRGQSPSGRWRSDGLAGVTRALGESLAP